MVIASIPDVPQCIAALKEDFRVSAEYSAETGKFLVEGTFEQVACAQVRLQEILQQELELQKHQLRRLSGRSFRHQDHPPRDTPTTGQYYSAQGQDWSGAGQHRPVTSQYGSGTVDHGCDWSESGQHHPISAHYYPGYPYPPSHWTEPWNHGPPPPSSDYQRTPSYEGQSTPLSLVV